MAAKKDIPEATPLEACERALRRAEITQIVLASIGLLVLVLGNVFVHEGMAVWAAGTAGAVVVFLYARQVSIATHRRLAYRNQVHDDALVLVSKILGRNVTGRLDAVGKQAENAPWRSADP